MDVCGIFRGQEKNCDRPAYLRMPPYGNLFLSVMVFAADHAECRPSLSPRSTLAGSMSGSAKATIHHSMLTT